VVFANVAMNDLYLLFSVAIDHGSDDREVTFKRLNSNNRATLTSYIVYKFHKLPFNNLENYDVKTSNFAANRPQIANPPSFGKLAFQNGLHAVSQFRFQQINQQ